MVSLGGPITYCWILLQRLDPLLVIPLKKKADSSPPAFISNVFSTLDDDNDDDASFQVRFKTNFLLISSDARPSV